jgi:hypothetical protein
VRPCDPQGITWFHVKRCVVHRPARTPARKRESEASRILVADMSTDAPRLNVGRRISGQGSACAAVARRSVVSAEWRLPRVRSALAVPAGSGQRQCFTRPDGSSGGGGGSFHVKRCVSDWPVQNVNRCDRRAVSRETVSPDSGRPRNRLVPSTAARGLAGSHVSA